MRWVGSGQEWLNDFMSHIDYPEYPKLLNNGAIERYSVKCWKIRPYGGEVQSPGDSALLAADRALVGRSYTSGIGRINFVCLRDHHAISP